MNRTNFSGWVAALFLAFVPACGSDHPTPSTDGWIRVNDDNGAVTYCPGAGKFGNPGYFNGDTHTGQEVGDWCKFSFTGTGVKWIGGRNNNHGKVDVFIDGKLDTTLDTTGPTWEKQLELYVKTGLDDGPHQLMLQLKTAGYQDFDAFDYISAPSRSMTAKNLGHVLLPDQVPYLNPKNRYPVGNGVAMAVGEVSGEWSQLGGPGYTTPNLIGSERLTLEVDGVVEPFSIEMKRAAKTGIYYGYEVRGDLQIRLIDYACPGEFWISRLVMIDNVSKKDAHDVRLRATVVPRTESGFTQWLAQDADHHRGGVTIQADTTTSVPFGGNNITNKAVVISFTDPASSAHVDGETYTVEAPVSRIAPGGSYQTALAHYFRQDDATDSQDLAAIRALKSVEDLEKSITSWQKWFDDVPPAYQLGKIKDERGRELVEGALAILKTNQSLDGGIIAHSTFYKEGYVRDAALGLRGLGATGHFDESKKWLIWMDHKLGIHGHLPDAMNCNVSLADKSNAFDCGDPNAEEPAEFLLCARDYYDHTHDLKTLDALHKTLQYCMDAQLKEADANGFKMQFNGDETEVCGAVDLSSCGTLMNDNTAKYDWSMSSVAMCAASVDFYMKYLQARGEDPTHYKNSQNGTTVNLNTELAGLLKEMDDDFWRTDVAEIPDGFHDAFRIKATNALPARRIVNFTLMPVYFGTPYDADRKARDVKAMAHYYNEKTGFLQLVPGADNGFEGHDLGYLLWGLVEINDPRKDEVYKALVNGPSVDCWGSFNEVYTADGTRNDHDLRSLETGVNVSALAKYWDLGR